jgi:hypothetical protein
MKKYSTGDIIRYLYHEMTATGSKAFEKALDQDPDLKMEYEELKDTTSRLDRFHSSPSPQVLARLMEYASTPCKTEQP